MQSSVFTGAEGEDVLSWLNKFEITAASNNWDEGKQCRSISLYFDKSALFCYTNCQNKKEIANQHLLKQSLKTRIHNPGK